MPSKLKKAIGAVKDQTSISLAKVSSNAASATLEVTVLKATSHDVVPIEDKYVHEILSLISASKSNAAACAAAIARRIGKTRNWIVALKSLMLVLRVFQDGDPYFPIEVLHTMKRGARILNLANFRDDSASCPQDYTAFVRSFALYLDERLDCFLTGKLQRRFTYKKRMDCIIINNNNYRNRRGNEPVVRDMKPAMLLDRIQFWQKLLDRAIATVPCGPAKANRLVLISLYAIVQETYDLYRDISDGLALLLDSFFHLQYQSCLSAFHACVKATKQFEELSEFYGVCKGLGVGRTSEYPSVQKISEELIQTLQEFLKDQATFSERSPPNPHRVVKKKSVSTSGSQSELANYSDDQYDTASDRGSGYGSACTSLEDLTTVVTAETSPSPSWWSVEQDLCISEEHSSEKTDSRVADPIEEMSSNVTGSSQSFCTSQEKSITIFDPLNVEVQSPQEKELQGAHRKGKSWEIVLFENINITSSPNTSPSPTVSPNNLLESSSSPDFNCFFQQSSMNKYNPFLQDNVQYETSTGSSAGLENFEGGDTMFSFPPTSPPPTISAENSNERTVELSQSPKESSMSPTCRAENSNERTVSPTFLSQNPKESSISPTFRANSKTFGDEIPKESTMELACCANNSRQLTVSPTFSIMIPRGESAEPTFGLEEADEFMALPTFSARGGECETSPEVFGSPFSIDGNDPFGPFYNVTSPRIHMSNNGPVNQESVTHQQRLWLEQQNKIIAKHLT